MNSLFRISFVAINAFMTLGINALPQASSPLPLKNNNNISTPLNNNSTSVAMSASASNNGTKAVSQLGFSQLGCFTSISSSSPAKSSKVLTQGQNVTNLITCLKACKDRNNSKAGGLITACAYGTSPQITCVGLVWNSVQLNSTMIVSTGVSKVANSICSNSCPAGIENGCGGPVNNVSSPSQPPALTVYALNTALLLLDTAAAADVVDQSNIANGGSISGPALAALVLCVLGAVTAIAYTFYLCFKKGAFKKKSKTTASHNDPFRQSKILRGSDEMITPASVSTIVVGEGSSHIEAPAASTSRRQPGINL